jgi:transcriptional regulator with XRE-family HTH domain
MKLADLLADLKGIGVTQEEIAAAIDRAQSTVSELARAKRPAYETVEALKKFHAEKMRGRGKRRHQARAA